MNTQINLKIPNKLLSSAHSYATKNGFGTVQGIIRETVRTKLFDETAISKKELILIRSLIKASKKNLYGSEKELFKKLK